MESPTLAAGRGLRQAAEPIGPADIHAWVIDLGKPLADPGQLLDPADRERARGYARPLDRAFFAASRVGLRLVLGSYLGAEPASLRFASGPAGRPALTGDHAGSLQFSMSRSADLALVAVSGGPVGADIERVAGRHGLADLIAARFSTAEVACIAGGCAGSPLLSFYRHWTAKEAYLKATGRGLAGLRDTELRCGQHPTIRSGGRTADGWTVSPLAISSAWAASIVARGPVTSCRRLAS